MKRLNILLTLLTLAAPLAAQDMLSIGASAGCTNVPRGTTTVSLPLFVRHTVGSPLSQIHGLSLTITFSPDDAVQHDRAGRALVGIQRTGIASGIPALVEGSTAQPRQLSYIFHGTGTPLPLHVQAPAPGDELARLSLTLRPDLPSRTRVQVQLRENASTTMLLGRDGVTNESNESTAGQRLTLRNTCIEVN